MAQHRDKIVANAGCYEAGNHQLLVPDIVPLRRSHSAMLRKSNDNISVRQKNCLLFEKTPRNLDATLRLLKSEPWSRQLPQVHRWDMIKYYEYININMHI
eukprot:GHVR01049653.1.p1 GENE.GHVR01049653.1~~GHVR01049653.1.p1  ORF type:complete len:100 (+),score=12.53 GHVR01049653.1:960-1259(+)